MNTSGNWIINLKQSLSQAFKIELLKLFFQAEAIGIAMFIGAESSLAGCTGRPDRRKFLLRPEANSP